MNEYTFEDIYVGMEETFTRTITSEHETMFREISGDTNPLHVDDEFAKEIGNGKFSEHVVYGMLSASLLSTLAGVYLPGKYSLIHSIDNISFKKPVFCGDKLTVTGTVVDKQEGLNLLLLKVKIKNQDNKAVITADMKVLVQK